jgi:hypothetical protein
MFFVIPVYKIESARAHKNITEVSGSMQTSKELVEQITHVPFRTMVDALDRTNIGLLSDNIATLHLKITNLKSQESHRSTRVHVRELLDHKINKLNAAHTLYSLAACALRTYLCSPLATIDEHDMTYLIDSVCESHAMNPYGPNGDTIKLLELFSSDVSAIENFISATNPEMSEEARVILRERIKKFQDIFKEQYGTTINKA